MRHLLPIVVATAVACGPLRSVTGYFDYGHPAELAGTWVDSARATPTDTVAWVLCDRGLDQTLTIHRASPGAGDEGRTAQLDGYGYWYARNVAPAADSGQICFRSRARGRDACFPFQLTRQPASDAGPGRRRLMIVGYVGRRDTRDRILIERR